MRAIVILMLGATVWPAVALAMPLPDCANQVVIAHAQVARVEKDGALILSDGRTAILEGVRLPGADNPGMPIAAEALKTLRQLALAAPLTLTTAEPRQDRYGRIRVQGFDHVWLQLALLERGLARVEIAPDREECAPDLYEAESSARAAPRGLWLLPQYAVRPVGALPPGLAGTFQLVEGKIVTASVHDGRGFLDFQEDYRHGFSVTIAPEDRKTFRKDGFALEDLVGRKIRLRGTIEEFGGRPEIALSNPYQIEILD